MRFATFITGLLIARCALSADLSDRGTNTSATLRHVIYESLNWTNREPVELREARLLAMLPGATREAEGEIYVALASLFANQRQKDRQRIIRYCQEAVDRPSSLEDRIRMFTYLGDMRLSIARGKEAEARGSGALQALEAYLRAISVIVENTTSADRYEALPRPPPGLTFLGSKTDPEYVQREAERRESLEAYNRACKRARLRVPLPLLEKTVLELHEQMPEMAQKFFDLEVRLLSSHPEELKVFRARPGGR
jgi:hypothetical protein